jgi:NAD(P)-dependent dehydrogenase (short-subunit alcohol dehydrogenase family)
MLLTTASEVTVALAVVLVVWWWLCRSPGPLAPPFEGATVVVVGAGSGIGLAATRLLSETGFSVVACVLNAEQEACVLRERLRNVSLATMDVTDSASVNAVVASLASLPSPGDSSLVAVVNLAAVVLPGPLEHVPLDHVTASFNVNCVGALRVVRAFLPLLRRARSVTAFRPRIINISSGAGVAAVSMHGPYSISKHALEALTGVLRQELRDEGVSVVAVVPGMVKTFAADGWEGNLSKAWDPKADSAYGHMRAAAVQHQNQMLKTAVDASDVARIIVQACSSSQPAARYVIGFEARAAVLLYSFAPSWFSDWVLVQARGAARGETHVPLVTES